MEVSASLHALLLREQSVQDGLQPYHGVRVHVPRKKARLLVAIGPLQRGEIIRAPIGLQRMNPKRAHQTNRHTPETPQKPLGVNFVFSFVTLLQKL